jgi:antitoxin ParD1/3/4
MKVEQHRMASAKNAILVDLGAMRHSVEDRVASGSYASTDEVIRAGLLALEREETGMNEWLTRLAEEAIADTRPSVPAAQAFRDIRAKHRRNVSEPTL